MQHAIPLEQVGPRATAMAAAVSACVHCGFCLPDCPTYRVLGEEMDSPRGRILLMKGALSGELALPEVMAYVDRCLGCDGCMTACPSGVNYGELITSFRAWSEEQRPRKLLDSFMRALILKTLPYPARFRWGAKLAYLAKPIRRWFPEQIRSMLDLLPPQLPRPESLPEFSPAVGKRRARVALLAGCAQQVLAPQINLATLRVLTHNGVEVLIPKAQGCCGALAAHTGALRQAVASARNNLRVLPSDVDAVVTNAAGCGSGMKEYALWFQGEPECDLAQAMSHRVSDVSQFLVKLGLIEPPPLRDPLKVVYQDACHLLHAQNIFVEPRRILEAIPNLQLITMPDHHICCGSAGTYNIEQPHTARELGARKARAILTTGADIVATGNIGCMMQIKAHLKTLGRAMPVLHTIELLDQAYTKTEIYSNQNFS